MIAWNFSGLTIILLFLNQLIITSDLDCKVFFNSAIVFAEADKVLQSVYLKCHFVFLINWKTKFKILYLEFVFTTPWKKKFRLLFWCLIVFYFDWIFNVQSVYRKYNSIFDLKTKQILKFFQFSFFNFMTKIEKRKNFLEFIFWFQIKKWIRKFWFLFFEIGFRSK